MFLKKKSLYILNLFLTLKKYDILELEIILKLKKRSILANIKVINKFLQSKNLNGIIRQNESFFIDKDEAFKIKSLKLNISIDNNERKDYIILKLLLFNSIKLNNSFTELDITRRTLNYDMKKIKNFVK